MGNLFRRFCYGDGVGILGLLLVNRNVEFFLDVFLEVFVPRPYVFLVHDFPFLLIPKDILEAADEGIGDGDSLAGIDQVGHRRLLRTH